MVIPKEFEGLDDLEAMLLTSILGTLIALKDDLISYQQAQNYWLSDFTAELFEAMSLSKDIIDLLQEAIKLEDLQQFSSFYNTKLDELITQSKQLIAKHYTEYNSSNTLPQNLS